MFGVACFGFLNFISISVRLKSSKNPPYFPISCSSLLNLTIESHDARVARRGASPLGRSDSTRKPYPFGVPKGIYAERYP
ncbi:hypothetical protein H1P_260012 [Hyella patelloides LEGE 07179]|uniref:Uncharacterized protein n=1 Tax=Hyella patelloides LEGE 07179 TaxID=945734 RepID=A0A563VSH6_9CYAN|nr:hypothetical protein H1P_260012 [Hyella patelloides LEGE 07179]